MKDFKLNWTQFVRNSIHWGQAFYTTASIMLCSKGKGKGQNIALKERIPHRAMERHLPYAITQCYLPPDRGECSPP